MEIRQLLLLNFFMECRLPAPFTVLLELDFLGYKLTVLARPIVRALAH